ncbi:MAG: hypothetical protein J7L50_00380 [Candidatus Odinarchaeota archaeon]|nr:hypothetical protein [Candidatus Odinarchaeota archaeon]
MYGRSVEVNGEAFVGDDDLSLVESLLPENTMKELDLLVGDVCCVSINGQPYFSLIVSTSPDDRIHVNPTIKRQILPVDKIELSKVPYIKTLKRLTVRVYNGKVDEEFWESTGENLLLTKDEVLNVSEDTFVKFEFEEEGIFFVSKEFTDLDLVEDNVELKPLVCMIVEKSFYMEKTYALYDGSIPLDSIMEVGIFKNWLSTITEGVKLPKIKMAYLALLAIIKELEGEDVNIVLVSFENEPYDFVFLDEENERNNVIDLKKFGLKDISEKLEGYINAHLNARGFSNLVKCLEYLNNITERYSDGPSIVLWLTGGLRPVGRDPIGFLSSIEPSKRPKIYPVIVGEASEPEVEFLQEIARITGGTTIELEDLLKNLKDLIFKRVVIDHLRGV